MITKAARLCKAGGGKEGFTMLRGIFAAILASVCFGVMPSGSKYALLHGMEPDCVLCYQVAVMVILAGLSAVILRESLKIPAGDALKLALLGMIGIGGTDYLLNLSYVHLPVSTATMVHFMYPALVLLVSVAFFGQKLTKFSAGAVVSSLIGLLLVTEPGETFSVPGALIAFLSGVCYAAFIIANDHGKVNRYPLPVKLTFMSLGALVFCSIKTGAAGTFAPPTDIRVALSMFLALGLTATVGFFAVTAAVKWIGASRTAFVNMLEPIVCVLGGVLFLHEGMSPRAFLGCVFVVGAVLLVAMDGRGEDGPEA